MEGKMNKKRKKELEGRTRRTNKNKNEGSQQ
jgi:hypothetical protein